MALFMEDNEKNYQDVIPPLLIHDPQLMTNGNLFTRSNEENVYETTIIDPVELGFIPRSTWSERSVSLQFLRNSYFARKNNVNRRFEHKLFNALRITQMFPNLYPYVGVLWVSDSVFKVNKTVFAQLLNIKTIDGGLFHKQGNFPRHGFVTVSDPLTLQHVSSMDLQSIDGKDVLLLTHQAQKFSKLSSEEEISQCRWDDPSTASRTALLCVGLQLPIDQ